MNAKLSMLNLDNTISFSQTTKNEIQSLLIKKGCCKHSFSDAIALKHFSYDRSEIILNEKLICDSCLDYYLAGLFVSFGSVSNPAKTHHLEFSLPLETERDAICELLLKIGFEAKKTQRKGRFIAYFKKSDIIVDFLARIGANNAYFEYVNSRIVKDLINDANRQVNFDSANIKKVLDASAFQIKIINSIIENGLFNELPEELKETAQLRINNPEVPLGVLGLKFKDPISKSGVNHRIDKIIEFAEKKKIL